MSITRNHLIGFMESYSGNNLICVTHDLFMYTASVIFDYYCRDRELSYIGGIGFQSTPPLEGAGVFNVPEGDSPQNTEPPFIAWFELLVSQTRS